MVVYRSIASVISAIMAALAGVLLALWLRYTGPDTTLSFAIMIDVLLMVVIGGMGTTYGAVIGVMLMIIAENYLPVVMGKIGEAAASIPFLSALLSADRWLLWLGILFILSVYFFSNRYRRQAACALADEQWTIAMARVSASWAMQPHRWVLGR